MTLVFVADMFLDNKSWGGAEKHDHAMILQLEKRLGIKVEKRLAKDWHSLKDHEYYLIGNFFTADKTMLNKVMIRGNYSLYEHDHHYCATRNPFTYGAYQVPRRQIINRKLYLNADSVFCMSRGHKAIVDQNVEANTKSVGCSFWLPERLEEIITYGREIEKIPKACIHNSDALHKRTQEAIDYCVNNQIPFELIQSTPDENEFLKSLAQYETFVFFPGSPETFNRTLIEAKMMNLAVITNEAFIGAASEPLWAYSGERLKDCLLNEAMPNALDIITKGIPWLKSLQS